MSRPTLQAFQASNAGGDVPPFSAPHDDLNKQIIRLLPDDGREAHDVMGLKLGVPGGSV